MLTHTEYETDQTLATLHGVVLKKMKMPPNEFSHLTKKGVGMGLLTAQDLKCTYSWTAVGDDDPKKTGIPDSTFLNRHEGYEVLPFINRFAEKHGLKQKESGLKTERMIRDHLPSNTRSHANVAAWLESNWKNF